MGAGPGGGPGTCRAKYSDSQDSEYSPGCSSLPKSAGILIELNKNTKLIDIIKAMMPGGSVIGCPKIRTLELLNKQEKESRNIFTGSFGYIKFNKDMRFNIIIRSILNYKNQSEISAASGVVLDSSSKKEFNENYIKAKSLLELFK